MSLDGDRPTGPTGGRLVGKVALIAGAAGGIGSAIARRFADEGARLALLDLAAERLANLAAELGGASDGVDESVDSAAALLDADSPSGGVWTSPVDVTDVAQLHQAFAAAEAHYDRLDIVVNAAGGSGRRHGDGPVDACTPEGFDFTIDLNLRAAFFISQCAVGALRRAGGGALVHVASVLGLVGVQDHFLTHAYAAAKGGVIALSRSVAVRYAREGIRCNVICPGLIETPMSMRARSDQTILAALKHLQPLAPLGEPGDVADAAVYLGSEESRFITGVTLPVDGGWSAQ